MIKHISNDKTLSLPSRCLGIFVIFLAVAFSLLAVLVTKTHILLSTDMQLSTYLQGWRDCLPKGVMAFISVVGSPYFKVAVLFSLFFFFDRGTFWFILVAVLGSALQVPFLQLLFHRVRPLGRIEHPDMITPYGFPSGHAMGAVVFFGVFAFLAIRRSNSPTFKATVLAVFSVITLSIGLQRIIDGAHWPTDILGGYMYGAMWLAIMIRWFEPWWRNYYSRRNIAI